jgi:hypothetical protein
MIAASNCSKAFPSQISITFCECSHATAQLCSGNQPLTYGDSAGPSGPVPSTSAPNASARRHAGYSKKERMLRRVEEEEGRNALLQAQNIPTTSAGGAVVSVELRCVLLYLERASLDAAAIFRFLLCWALELHFMNPD